MLTTYSVIRNVSEIDIFGRNGAPVRVDPSRQSIIYVYYGDKYVKEFEQSMISTWYDLLSSLGGIVALITGGSLMTIVEIGYILTGRFGASYVKDWVIKYRKKREIRRRLWRDHIDDDTLREDEVPPFMPTRKSTMVFAD